MKFEGKQSFLLKKNRKLLRLLLSKKLKTNILTETIFIYLLFEGVC